MDTNARQESTRRHRRSRARSPGKTGATGSAPAKLILLGEHAVVHGEPALGIALARGVDVTLTTDGRGRIRTRLAPGIARDGLTGAATPRDLVRAALKGRLTSLDVAIAIGIPPGAGFGTSAAIAVALLRALDALDGREPSSTAELVTRATDIERVAHGNPSGLDPAICACAAPGRVVRFVRRGDRRTVRAIEPGAPIDLAIGVMGTHGATHERVRGVATLRERAPKLIRAAIRTLGAASVAGAEAIERGDLAALGLAMNLAHGVLGGLGLVNDEIERLVRAARASGAVGAKMSGAGGGGAFFALAEDHDGAKRIAKLWTKAGASAWTERVG